jgi:hypothetical protein
LADSFHRRSTANGQLVPWSPRIPARARPALSLVLVDHAASPTSNGSESPRRSTFCSPTPCARAASKASRLPSKSRPRGFGTT